MSKEQLLQEFADAYEQLIGTATEAAQRGVTRQGDEWGPREIVAHLAGWEVMATVRIPRIVAGMPPAEFADETQQTVMNDAINAAMVTLIEINRSISYVACCARPTSVMSSCSGSWKTSSSSQVNTSMNERKTSLSIVKNTCKCSSSVTPDAKRRIIPK